MFRTTGAAFLLALVACAASAQTQDGYRVIETGQPPRGDASAQMDPLARSRGIDTAVTYVTRLEGDLADGPAFELREGGRAAPAVPQGPGSVPVVAVLVILALALLLWLRFGGAGGLLAATPKPDRPRGAAPDAWAISHKERETDPQRLLAQIAAMTDRRAAMVRLLHHCLLFAGDDSDTRFARADTEREAFRRLPDGWRLRDALRGLLGRTELAHYGGREVDEQGFAAALDLGRAILLSGAGRHA